MRINLPNQITIGRLVVSGIFLVLMARFEIQHMERDLWMLDIAAALFVISALGDILDGYLARKQNQVTAFGRVLDPFVDKILVLGAFVLLLGDGYAGAGDRNVTGLEAWMVVVIISRELFVSSVRGFSEAAGQAFGANIWGKIKMWVQSITVVTIILSVGRLREAEWAMTIRTAMIWFALFVTIGSMTGYLSASRRALSEKPRG